MDINKPIITRNKGPLGVPVRNRANRTARQTTFTPDGHRSHYLDPLAAPINRRAEYEEVPPPLTIGLPPPYIPPQPFLIKPQFGEFIPDPEPNIPEPEYEKPNLQTFEPTDPPLLPEPEYEEIPELEAMPDDPPLPVIPPKPPLPPRPPGPAAPRPPTLPPKFEPPKAEEPPKPKYALGDYEEEEV
jgi:hypothetical protein